MPNFFLLEILRKCGNTFNSVTARGCGWNLVLKSIRLWGKPTESFSLARFSRLLVRVSPDKSPILRVLAYSCTKGYLGSSPSLPFFLFSSQVTPPPPSLSPSLSPSPRHLSFPRLIRPSDDGKPQSSSMILSCTFNVS